MANASIDHWSAILTLVLFVLSNAAVMFPVRVLIPAMLVDRTRQLLVAVRVLARTDTSIRKTYLHLNFITVPLISVLLLLATRAIDGSVVRDGVVGANGVQPLDIMALFISLAYLSISLDATGLLRFLAFWVVRKGGSSGKRLFAYLYVFFLVCGVLVGNDPVILSGTAFLAYLTRVSGVTNPKAWIFSQFAAANMASVVLVSSNPTNLVLSGAFALEWTSYIAHVALPFLGAAAAVYPLLLYLFRASDLIPNSLDLDLGEVGDMRETLVDRGGAIFGSGLVLVTLGVLVGTSTVGVPVWEVTVPPACIMLARDVWWDVSRYRSLKIARAQSAATADNELPDGAEQPARDRATTVTRKTKDDSIELQEPVEQRAASHAAPARTPLSLADFSQHHLSRLRVALPTVSSIAARLPLPLLPFAFLTFILVSALAAQGWVALFARWWGAWVRVTGVPGAVAGMGLLSCIFCNVCGTNIGATILLARVLQLWVADAASAPTQRERYGAVYALALGSNFGAFTLTFGASLAGLLWRRILRQKGIRVRAREFARVNAPIAGVAMAVGCAVLLGEVYVVYK